jgi:hypothetical protein
MPVEKFFMRRLWVLALLLPFSGIFASADSVFQINDAVMAWTPDNNNNTVSFTFKGNNVAVSGGGAVACGWCFTGPVGVAGDMLSGPLSFTFQSVNANINGTISSCVTLDPSLCTGGITVFLNSLTLPSMPSGSTFTAKLPVSSFQFFAPALPGIAPFSLSMPSTQVLATFQNSGGAWSLNQAVLATVPEPGTITLLTLGLGALGTAVGRSRLARRT